MPAEIEVCAIQLPGRGERLREKPPEDLDDVLEQLLPTLDPLLDRPFAIFGHSMGAILATSMAMALSLGRGPLPAHLFVSGRRPPHLPDNFPKLGGLNDDAFLAALGRRYGALPAEVLAEPELLALLLPTLRADIRSIERYRQYPAPVSLPFAITAMGGDVDAATSADQLEAWRPYSSIGFRLRVFGGGHFYFEQRRGEVLAYINESLQDFLRSEESRS